MKTRGKARKPQAARRELGAEWEESTQSVLLGLRDWRALHPQATLAEIEAELDRRLQELRAQMLADLALASAAGTLDTGDRPPCPECGGHLIKAGQHARTVRTVGNRPVRLERQYAECPACGSRVFPPGSGA